MAVTNEEIEERFELDAERVIRWRRVSADGMPRWAKAKADELNRKAGEEVKFFPHATGGLVVKLYGGMVAESRIRKVLQRQTVRDVAVDRERAAQSRAKRAAGAGRKAAAKPPSGYEAEQRAAARKRHVRMALGFMPQPTGLWQHEDGRTWHDSLMMAPAALAAGEEYDAMEEARDE